MQANQEVTKKKLSHYEFEKKVEIEAQNLMYFEYKDKQEAFKEARAYIQEKYELE